MASALIASLLRAINLKKLSDWASSREVRLGLFKQP